MNKLEKLLLETLLLIRQREGGEAWLSKEELAMLSESFRVQLAHLVRENNAVAG